MTFLHLTPTSCQLTCTYTVPSITPKMTVSPHEVYNKLKRINTSKSGGPGSIQPLKAKEFGYELSFPITDIFKKRNQGIAGRTCLFSGQYSFNCF